MRRPGTPPANKGQRYPPEVLTTEEVAALLATLSRRAPTGIRNRALVMLLYRSGLRISEALALRPGDVNFDDHSLRLLATKSGEAQTRGFHPSADDALMRWTDTRKALGIGNHGRKLFCTITIGNIGNPMSAVSARKMLREAAEQAGIDKRVHPHGFRHTFAKEMEDAGIPVSTITALLGHAGVANTSKYLRSLTNAQAVHALAELDLGPLGGPQAGATDEKDAADALAAQMAALTRRLAVLEAGRNTARAEAREARRVAEQAKRVAAEELIAEWAAAQPEEGEAAPLVLALPLSSLRLTTRPYNCLRREGIDTIAHLLARSVADVAAMRNMGAASVEEIRQKLAENGLALKGDANPSGEA